MKQMSSSLAWAYLSHHRDEPGFEEFAGLAQIFVRTSFPLNQFDAVAESNTKIHQEIARFFAYHRLLCKLT